MPIQVFYVTNFGFLVKVLFVLYCSFTQRVTTLIGVLKDLNKGVYKRTMVSSKKDWENDDGNFVVNVL